LLHPLTGHGGASATERQALSNGRKKNNNDELVELDPARGLHDLADVIVLGEEGVQHVAVLEQARLGVLSPPVGPGASEVPEARSLPTTNGV